jgi:hypothetical protein
MLAAHIDHGDGGICEVGIGRLAADDRDAIAGHEQATGEELVLMRAAGVGENAGE